MSTFFGRVWRVGRTWMKVLLWSFGILGGWWACDLAMDLLSRRSDLAVCGGWAILTALMIIVTNLSIGMIKKGAHVAMNLSSKKKEDES